MGEELEKLLSIAFKLAFRKAVYPILEKELKELIELGRANPGFQLLTLWIALLVGAVIVGFAEWRRLGARQL